MDSLQTEITRTRTALAEWTEACDGGSADDEHDAASRLAEVVESLCDRAQGDVAALRRLLAFFEGLSPLERHGRTAARALGQVANERGWWT